MSSSCDGTVRVWDLTTNKVIKTLLLVPKSNDFRFILCTIICVQIPLKLSLGRIHNYGYFLNYFSLCFYPQFIKDTLSDDMD